MIVRERARDRKREWEIKREREKDRERERKIGRESEIVNKDVREKER